VSKVKVVIAVSKVKVIKRYDVSTSEPELIQKIIQEAHDNGGFLHIEIRKVVKP